MWSTNIKSVDTIVFIATTSISVTFSFTGCGLIVIPKSSGVDNNFTYYR